MHNKNKKEVTKGYLGPDIKAKRTVKTNRRGTTTTKEKEDQFSANHLGHKPADYETGGFLEKPTENLFE